MCRSKTGVLAVDDFEQWRDFVLHHNPKDSDLDVVGVASDGPEAIKKAAALYPDLLVLDIGICPVTRIVYVVDEDGRSLDLVPNMRSAEKSDSRSSGIVLKIKSLYLKRP